MQMARLTGSATVAALAALGALSEAWAPNS